MRVVLAVLLVIAGCGDNVRGNISINAPGPWLAAFRDFAAFTDYSDLSLGTDGDYQIEVIQDETMPAEGYRLDELCNLTGECAVKAKYVVYARDLLGAQYGAAAALENLGFRFRHPFETYVPRAPTRQTEVFSTGLFSITHQPQVRVRGLQLHTLHPIEGYFAFWEPSLGSTNDAHRIIDWLIKNRGNYLQWVGLDNIMDPAQHETWQAFTRELIDYAHSRGVRVGLNLQLFGKSNLQLAFDLSDDDTKPLAQQVSERLPLITDQLPFDVYALSFGEFFGAEPQKFIDSTNEVAKQLRTFAPAAEMHAVVHVGATQRVQYDNRDLLYYFLVQYADPSIIPDIHTVMFYNLLDDAGGAYQHQDFAEHREYITQRMCSGQRVAYFPETAYWVAFDDSVPMYMPLYIYSRWNDLKFLDDTARQPGCAPLDEHLLFSTGWEWGYWLNDVISLRASYEHGVEPEELITEAYAPDLGVAAGHFIGQLMAEQKTALIDQHLIGYLVGRDIAIDAGDKLDPPIISQPDRITFDDLIANRQLEAALIIVLADLDGYAATLDRLESQLGTLDLPDSRWSRELRDGVAIDRLRVRFVVATYNAVLAHVRNQNFAPDYEKAKELLARARKLVASRHADLHDTHGRRLVDKTPNNTFYQFGYLYMADTLCYWQRELDQVGQILGTSTAIPNTCLF